MRRLRSLILHLILVTFLTLSTLSFGGNDQDTCPVCNLPVLRDTASQDNRVILIRDGKVRAYRCALCALAAAKLRKGDVAILAPSDKKGEPVKLVRARGNWTILPETAVFAYAKGSHVQCQNRYRAMCSYEAFDSYAKANLKLIGKTKPLTLKELLAMNP